jgi:hypothetical protein
MVEAGTLCINADVIKKSGVNASAVSTAEAYTNVFIKEAEAYISAITRYDWVTNYTSVSTIGKEILREAASSHAAIAAINYDMAGFNTRTEVQTMLDVLYSKFVDCINVLKDDQGRKFVIQGSTA